MRLTFQSLLVLSRLLEGSCYLNELSAVCHVRTGTLYYILQNMLRHGYVVDRWESGDPVALGRPLVRFYSLTVEGERIALGALSALRGDE